MSIGVADGAEEYMIGEIADIALGRDGSIYAFDRQVPVIRHYDAGGRFLRNIGRNGAGPGEYRSASGLATMRDGRLLLWDTWNWRINVYSESGEVLTQWTTPSGMSDGVSTFTRAMLVDTAGLVITRKIIFKFGDVMNSTTAWLRFRPDGTPVDTIHAPVGPEVMGRLYARSGRAQMYGDVPFAPKRVITMSPLGYLIAGYADRYAFEIHEPGRAVVSVRRDVKPEPVSRTERADARRRSEERMRRQDPNWSWNGPDIPAVKPYYSDIHVGLDSRIWISIIPEVSPRVGSSSSGAGMGNPGRRPPPPSYSEPPRPALYDVFEPDGTYLGQVQVPAKVSSVVRRGDHVWAVAFDAEDVPRIKRYRIAWR
jgi:hypothetical protein